MTEPEQLNISNKGQDRTSPDAALEWLTVSEAVAHCSIRGLSRTPKTVRRWAHRSVSDPETADLIVRREDVDTGFRWSIECNSLERKIEQELEFELRKSSGHVFPSADQFEPVHESESKQTQAKMASPFSGPDRTGADTVEPVPDLAAINDELRGRIDDLKSQVEFYEEEFRDRRQTTRALTDVITAFRLNAETQANQSRTGSSNFAAGAAGEEPNPTNHSRDGQAATPSDSQQNSIRKLAVNGADRPVHSAPPFGEQYPSNDH